MSITEPKSTTVAAGGVSPSAATMPHHDRKNPNSPPLLPLVVTLNCIEDNELEQESLAGVATVEHVGLNRLADGKIESAGAVLLHSLAFLPRAAQRRLKPWQLVLCLGSSDRAVDSALAADLGLRLVHVDVSRAEEIADTVMALILGLLRRTHLLSHRSLSSSGWLGSVQPLCRGMRRCRGLVLGIIGRSASARSLATRCLSFKMNVFYFDVHQGQESRSSITFPPAARRMETLNDLLAASDMLSLHCTLTDDTVQILNFESLQHIKPGAYLINTGSSQLLDDCAVKQLLIDGTIAGCALDGAEGPQWMEAWVREMPNVLILPRSADYSEEVWTEIREKAISILQTYFLGEPVPSNAVSDEEDEDNEITYGNEQHDKKDIERVLHRPVESSMVSASSQGKDPMQLESPSQHQESGLSPSISNQFDGKSSRSRKKAKKRHARQKSQHKTEDIEGKESASQQDDDTARSGTEQAQSCGSPEDSRSRETPIESNLELSASLVQKSDKGVSKKSVEPLKDGCVIALHAKEHSTLYVSRQRVKGGGWFLDTMPSVTNRDPAAQFLVEFIKVDTIGLRSLAAGGKLLQINRKMEFVFAGHSFDVWESWSLAGPLEDCRIVNCRNIQAFLDVRIEVLATVGEDGVLRWLD